MIEAMSDLRTKLQLAALTQTTVALTPRETIEVYAMLEAAVNFRKNPDGFRAPFERMLDGYEQP